MIVEVETIEMLMGWSQIDFLGNKEIKILDRTWLAMDMSGNVYGYTSKPQMMSAYWHLPNTMTSSDVCYIGKALLTDQWDNSLINIGNTDERT